MCHHFDRSPKNDGQKRPVFSILPNRFSLPKGPISLPKKPSPDYSRRNRCRMGSPVPRAGQSRTPAAATSTAEPSAAPTSNAQPLSAASNPISPTTSRISARVNEGKLGQTSAFHRIGSASTPVSIPPLLTTEAGGTALLPLASSNI